MIMQSKCVILGLETYTSKKNQEQYARALLVDEGGTNPVAIVTKDFSIMQLPLYTVIKGVFDFSEKYSRLSLIAFEPMPVSQGK